MRIVKMNLYFSIVISIIMFLSCNQGIVSPVEEPPGRRDYTWKIDTLDMPNNLLDDIWGASVDDVWAIGQIGMDLDKIMHYNGNSWTKYTKELISCDDGEIFGFDNDEVWFAGGPDLRSGTTIWKWDGKTWSKNYHYDIGAHISTFTDIYGTNQDDVYACGVHLFKDPGSSKGFVLHYNGTRWQEVFLANNNSQYFKIRSVNRRVILTMYNGSDLDSISICELRSDSIYQIYSNSTQSIRNTDFEIIENELYLMINQDIYKVLKHKLVKILSVEDSNFGYRFCGRNENDIFLRMRDGLAHYNGTDIRYIYQVPLKRVNVRARNLLFEKDVFFCLREEKEGKILNMVLHGALTN